MMPLQGEAQDLGSKGTSPLSRFGQESFALSGPYAGDERSTPRIRAAFEWTVEA